MRVDVAADLGQLVEIGEHLGNDRHGGSGGRGLVKTTSRAAIQVSAPERPRSVAEPDGWR
jgi:hypothetical protein